jgi:hypothetical protein
MSVKAVLACIPKALYEPDAHVASVTLVKIVPFCTMYKVEPTAARSHTSPLLTVRLDKDAIAVGEPLQA